VLLTNMTFTQESKKEVVELGITAYGANIAFAGFDIDIVVPFYQQGINRLSFKTSLMTYIPSSIFQSQAPYVLFGSIFELQYMLSHRSGMLFGIESGLGITGEFIQSDVYTEDKGFHRDYRGTPYGMFSVSMRIGYDFQHRTGQPIKLAFFGGYRMQFPYNFTVKHFLLFGASLSFSFGRK
ncbi:MAG: hypothetical protein ACRC0X_10205, partial [Brevinema sp.]